MTCCAPLGLLLSALFWPRPPRAPLLCEPECLRSFLRHVLLLLLFKLAASAPVLSGHFALRRALWPYLLCPCQLACKNIPHLFFDLEQIHFYEMFASSTGLSRLTFADVLSCSSNTSCLPSLDKHGFLLRSTVAGLPSCQH